MGRPLKIAKAQALLTVTNTTAITNVVTVSQTLADFGVIAGMPFVPSVTTGTNLVAGTTYWILEITGASTFTVSATQLSANPTFTPVTLTTGTTASTLSVGVVDAYFNNPVSGVGYPATNTSTYSVVGGNTAIYGKQVLVGVAIGVQGTGNIYATTSSADVWGVTTDFANASPAIVAGTAIQAVNANINGTTTPVDLGFVSSLYHFEANVTDTYANGYVNTDDNTGFNSNKPVWLTGNIGGLVANTPYFVTTIDGGGQLITLSTEPNGANVTLTAASGTVPIIADAVTLAATSAANTNDGSGDPFTNFVYANDEAGYIVRQKGKQKYLVTGTTTGLTAPCFTANVANTALTPNTMSILATYANASTTLVQSLSDHTLEIFGTGDVLPNSSPAFATFNTAYAANTYGGQPYPIVTINNA